jgi:HlyD family secretion protein
MHAESAAKPDRPKRAGPKRWVPVLIILLVLGILAGVYYAIRSGRHVLVLTGIVTTDEVTVSSEIQGRLQQLLVNPGDIVQRTQLVARIQPQEWKAEASFYANTELQSAAQVAQAEADLKFQEAQSINTIIQAEANLAAAKDLVTQAKADLENAETNYLRLQGLYQRKVESPQAYDQARTAFESVKARAASVQQQAQAAEAAVAIAKAERDRVEVRRAAVEAAKHQWAAAGAQKQRAEVRLDYTEIRAPIPGIVDVRAALAGEVVSPGQAIVTLIDPDNLWVRADVEETYIDQIRLGDKLTVRLPSGAQREGVVFYRAVDADYATQRDVSRTKRDIRTFEIRLRCDNKDRGLAVGMTAYVSLPLGGQPR